MAIDCLVLGAGQEVGKSCVVVSINGKRIMFDCGMHMGYTDSRRYPDFSLISKTGDFDNALTCVIITHFHLDHIGALPYFTEVCGYRGPVYMTYPTKALAPLMLEDYRKNMDRRGEDGQFTSDHITECMKKVIPVDLKQTVQVDKDLQIRAYYAGHVVVLRWHGCVEENFGIMKIDGISVLVLGAAMFYAKVGDAAMVYTGDYNMTPDRHLGAAQIDRLQLDLLITESTYATTIRDSRYGREREFLKAVHNCVAAGGKVLIPTFALGRAQEKGGGLTIQANMYYKMLINWTSQKIKETYATHNAFDFKNVQNFDRSLINAPGPCVLFATPGMISGGFSLEVFMQWAPSEINLITLPGYCVAGTIGHKLMSGKPTKIDLDKDTQVDVRCQIHQLSFSPHTDAKGIMDLVKFLSPKHAILVHGEKPKMATLKERIQSELGIQCYCPANNDTVTIPTTHYVKADASDAFIKSCLNPNFKFSKSSSVDKSYSGSNDSKAIPGLQVSDERVAEGILVVEKGKKAKVIHQDELLHMLGENKHEVQFAYCFPMRTERLEKTRSEDLPSADDLLCGLDKCTLISLLSTKLSNELSDGNIQDLGEQLQVESFCLSICLKDNCPHRISDSLQNDSEVVFFCCSWSVADEMLAWKIISIMKNYTLPLEALPPLRKRWPVGSVPASFPSQIQSFVRCHHPFQVLRSYARGGRKHYDLFGSKTPGDKDFRKAWQKEMDEDETLWTGSEDESDPENDETDSKNGPSRLEREIRKVRQQAKEHSELIDADDSDELRSVWSGSDEEKTLWTGSECDDDDDIPTEAYPNETSDKYIDKLFEFEEKPKYRTISELLKSEKEPEELSPGKKARKLAVENALKKLKKGPDGRYTNVWEVMSDIDILIGAFENIVSGPEYEELRQGGPKKLDMQFFKDIQAHMRDPNYKFSPELKLKPKSKLVPKKKWQKAQSRRRKAQKR
ncbi:hypothetical protein QUC31_013938 [Theobroma cacao]